RFELQEFRFLRVHLRITRERDFQLRQTLHSLPPVLLERFERLLPEERNRQRTETQYSRYIQPSGQRILRRGWFLPETWTSTVGLQCSAAFVLVERSEQAQGVCTGTKLIHYHRLLWSRPRTV